MEVTISPMTNEDLGEVLEIERDSFICPWSRGAFEKELLRNSHAYYIVAKYPLNNNKTVGYGGVWLLFDEAHITTLAVHPSHRRTGIGSALLRNLLQQSFLKGVSQVVLEVRDSNYIAQRMYEKYGFKEKGKRRNYYYDEDAVVMVCMMESFIL